MLENYFLPQFTSQRKVTSEFHLFNKIKEDGYDVIIGRDILKTMGLQIHYDTESFVWDNIKVKMVPRRHWDRASIKAFWQHRENAEENNISEIKPAEYQVANLQDIAEQQTHLSSLERAKLYSTLSDFAQLFQGTPGKYNGDPIHLELLSGSKPFFSKAYSIPKAYLEVTKGEIERLESIGLLSQVQSAEWAAPTFVIPKKNGSVRLITDFRMLNKCLARRPFPMPKIPEIFRGMEQFKYVMTLDLNIGYYSMPLNDASK
jgi:hypothetical protein